MNPLHDKLFNALFSRCDYMSVSGRIERDVSRMTLKQLRRAYLRLLKEYEIAEAFRQRAVDRECSIEKANQAIITGDR